MSGNMPIRDIRTYGIVLRRTNYGEADRILNVITPLGKVTAIAKGVRKTRSKLAGGVEMFTLTDYNIHLGRSEMGVVTGARMMQHYSEIMKDFGRMELAGMILKKVSRAAEGSDNAEFFEIVKQCMEGLDVGISLELVEGWFLLNLMKATGEEVNLYRDVKGEKLTVDGRYNWDTAGEVFYYDDNGKYGADEIKMLRLMTTVDLKTVRRVKVTEEMYDDALYLVRMAAHV